MLVCSCTKGIRSNIPLQKKKKMNKYFENYRYKNKTDSKQIFKNQ